MLCSSVIMTTMHLTWALSPLLPQQTRWGRLLSHRSKHLLQNSQRRPLRLPYPRLRSKKAHLAGLLHLSKLRRRWTIPLLHLSPMQLLLPIPRRAGLLLRTLTLPLHLMALWMWRIPQPWLRKTAGSWCKCMTHRQDPMPRRRRRLQALKPPNLPTDQQLLRPRHLQLVEVLQQQQQQQLLAPLRRPAGGWRWSGTAARSRPWTRLATTWAGPY